MKKIGSCTTILVGKNAALDGATLIARNEDCGGQAAPQKFVVVSPEDQPEVFHCVLSDLDVPLPKNPLRYTATPDVDDAFGVWAASGINSENVAMTATETITTNSRILALDPLVENGIGEADFVSIVLPYIHSAREGVKRMGTLLETYGTYESNGMAFSDKDEIWYLETIGGHHWAAIKIPDDAYVVGPNRMNIDDYNFDSENTMYSADLPDLIAENQLNPDFEGINLRHIFGSSDQKDTRYNNPRAWFVQQHFSNNSETNPIDQELPFICYPKKKLSVEDVKWALSSHYENTPFDPYGTGTEAEKKQFRPIALNRNQQVHILQILPNVPAEVAGIHWLAFGPNTFNAVIPFFANVLITPDTYGKTTTEYDPSKMYWLTQTLALLGDNDYSLYAYLETKFEQDTVAACRKVQLDTIVACKTSHSSQKQLETANQKMADISLEKATELLGKMVKLGISNMKLSY